MTKKQFDLKYRGEKVAVHCDTEEKAKAFLGLAKSFGYKWSNGKDLDKSNFWVNYKEDLCFSLDPYYIGFIMGGVEIHKQEGYKIIPFALDEPKETFNVGDVVYVKALGNKYIIKEVVTRYILDGNNYTWTAEELTKQKPLNEITEKELADMGFVLKK